PGEGGQGYGHVSRRADASEQHHSHNRRQPDRQLQQARGAQLWLSCRVWQRDPVLHTWDHLHIEDSLRALGEAGKGWACPATEGYPVERIGFDRGEWHPKSQVAAT